MNQVAPATLRRQMHTSRVNPTTGLTDAEVASRVAAGQVNVVPAPPDRSFGQIVVANTFTMVNAIIVTLFVLVVISGNPQDGLFVGVVVANSVIGVVQETRSRRELHRLEVITEPRATVVRSGTSVEVATEEIVLDDIVELRLGGQVAVDGTVVESTGLRLDESMLTGESLPVDKAVGDEVRSGSFVVAGNGSITATGIGADSYASRLAAEAKQFAPTQSQLRRGIDRILRWLTWVIPVATVFLFVNLLNAEEGWQDALLGTVAAAVAMVPDGLVLLTSLAFMAGAIALARRNALVKQLSTVEVLARVDVLCLDKTGTITTGKIRFAALHPAPGRSDSEATTALAALAAADRAPNATMAAIAAEIGNRDHLDGRSGRAVRQRTKVVGGVVRRSRMVLPRRPRLPPSPRRPIARTGRDPERSGSAVVGRRHVRARAGRRRSAARLDDVGDRRARRRDPTGCGGDPRLLRRAAGDAQGHLG